MEIQTILTIYGIGYLIAFLTNIFYYGAENLTKRIWIISLGSWISVIFMILINKD